MVIGTLPPLVIQPLVLLLGLELGFAECHIMVYFGLSRTKHRFGLDHLIHPLVVLHNDELIDRRHRLVESADLALIVEVHLHQQQPGVEGLGRPQQKLDLEIIQLDHPRDSVLPELLAEAAGLAQRHAHDFVEPAPQRVDGVEMLVFPVLALEVVPDLGELLVVLVEAEELLLQLVGPDTVDLEPLMLETAASLELFVAAHGVVHAVQLHLPQTQLQGLLDHYVELDG